MSLPRKSFDRPDRVIEAPGVRQEVVELGSLIVGRVTHSPGWRWSTHIRPTVGTERCEIRHVGVVVAGHMGLELSDGSVHDLGPDTVYDIPPGHDGWVIGDAPLVAIDWMGAIEWLSPIHGQRLLASLLFTDIVDSTRRAEQIGDRAWRALISAHDDAVRHALAAARGREISTVGDGFLAIFEGPARAIQTALRIREQVHSLGIEIRQGIHVGEVEVVGPDLRGLAVHEAARVMSVAGAGQIFVSAVTRTLATGSGYRFVSRGLHALKGLPGTHELFAVETD